MIYRLNVGAGNKRPDGYFNIDAVQHPKATPLDLVADVRSIPLPDGCAREVMAIHVVEHIYPHDLHATLTEWHRLLQPGGLLVLELPDIVKCAKNMLKGLPDNLGLQGIYGENPEGSHYSAHKYGWTFSTLGPRVANAGFSSIIELQTQYHSKGKGIRDFRLEARKPL